MNTLERIAELALLGMAAWFAVIAIGVGFFLALAVWQDWRDPVSPGDDLA